MTPATTGHDIVHSIGADGIVSVRVRDGDVRIRAVDGDIVRVRDAGARDLGPMFDITLGDGSASLLYRDRWSDWRTSGHGRAPELELDLPRRATIVIETVSADVEADGMLGDQRYQTTSGDITLRGVSGALVIEAVSADLDIRATGETDVTARTVSGDVELRAATLRSLDLTTTSGDVKVAGQMRGPGPFAVETVSGDAQLAPAGDVRIEMATMSGDLSSEVHGRIEGARGHRTLVIGSSGPLVTFRSMSGDLNVVRPVPVLSGAPLPDAPPAPPVPPAPPSPLDPPPPPTASVADSDAEPVRNGAIDAAYEDARLGVLRALERGEIDVAEAGRRFEALDGGAPLGGVDPADDTTRLPLVEPDDA